MITLEHVYILTGVVFGAIAVASARDGTNPKRFGNAAFWGLLAASFLFGSHIGDRANGVIVLGLIIIGGFGLLGHGKPAPINVEERRASAARFGNLLFLPALIIPATALAGTVLLKNASLGGVPLVDAKQVTVISLGLGAVIALVVAMVWLKPPLDAPLEEG